MSVARDMSASMVIRVVMGPQDGHLGSEWRPTGRKTCSMR